MKMNHNFLESHGDYHIYVITDLKGTVIGYMLVGPDGPINPSFGPDELEQIRAKAIDLKNKAEIVRKIKAGRQPQAPDAESTDTPGMS